MMKQRRFFQKKDQPQIIVAVEGIDGAGKTTIIDAVSRLLGNQACVLSRTAKSKKWEAILNKEFFRKHRFFQIPIYYYLSYANYLKNRRKLNAPVLIMDRCFLSNICYYYPSAVKSRLRFSLSMLFELKLFPSTIYIVDEDPIIAQKRDNYQKPLEWLETTRKNYLELSCAKVLKPFNIRIIPSILNLDEKIAIVFESIIHLNGKTSNPS